MGDIVEYPSSILQEKSSLVTIDEAADLEKKLLDVYATLPENAVGLAAAQIGINKNIAIVLGVPMMNLEFRPANMIEIEKEGCFSLNYGKDFFSVKRAKYGWGTWQDPKTGESFKEKLTGLRARVFQHELDHINGKMCHTE